MKWIKQIAILALAAIILVGCSTTVTKKETVEVGEKDKSTESNSNKNEKEKQDESAKKGELNTVDVSKYDFSKDESDLKQVIKFNKKKPIEKNSSTTNERINGDPIQFVTGEKTILQDHEMIVGKDGMGKEIDYPFDPLDTYTAIPVYVNGYYFIGIQDKGFFKIDEKTAKAKQISKDQPDIRF